MAIAFFFRWHGVATITHSRQVDNLSSVDPHTPPKYCQIGAMCIK